MAKVLVIDDQKLMRDSIERILLAQGLQVQCASDAEQGLTEIAADACDVVISDLRLPGADGLEILRRVKQQSPHVPVILITAYGSVAGAVEAMKLGAFDYIEKPFDADRLEAVMHRALDHRRLALENEVLRSELGDRRPAWQLVGSSRAMNELTRRIELVACSKATVFVTGPTGSGKELAARAIHALSDRRDGPFFAVNCAALSSGLLESELFGHEKGAFTGADRARKGRFELADGGTLMLDEVSEIDVGLQAKLLRVLQEREFERVGSSVTRRVDVRVIATTNRDLQKEVADKRFRQDLYFRLKVVPVEVPPLCEHREDIPELVEHFTKMFAGREGRRSPQWTASAMRLLGEYDWPGNVRELANVVERACVLGLGPDIAADDIKGWLDTAAADDDGVLKPGMTIADAERILIGRTLAKFGGHRARTAKALGIGLRTLTNKIKKWGF